MVFKEKLINGAHSEDGNREGFSGKKEEWEGWNSGYPFHNRSSCPWESVARGEGAAFGAAISSP